MKSIKENFKKNIEILQINLERGMSCKQAFNAIDNQEKQFISFNTYGEDEKDYINEMRATVIKHFMPLTINIIK